MKRMTYIWALMIISSSLFGALFDPGADLYTISTEYFDFIYSAESRDTAYYLAQTADANYLRFVSLLERNTNERITVTITSAQQNANGMSLPVPYNQIKLYDSPPGLDSSIGNYQSWMEQLFIHELVHSLSLTIRPAFLEPVSRIFGSVILPELAMQPWFMVEGVTVSFESLDGYGRGNDPFIENILQQDILQDNFKTVSQSTGPFDRYPGGSIPYYYGGYFSLYLQEKYGMESYARLWHDASKMNIFKGLRGVFENVYGVGLTDEWALFEEDISPDYQADTNVSFLFDSERGIVSPVADGTDIYYYNSFELTIEKYDIINDTTETICSPVSGIESLSLSPDGKRLLVCYYALPGNTYKASARIFDIETDGFIDEEYSDIREASFFDDGIIGIRLDGHNTDLVLIENGQETVLLEGYETLSFGSPRQYNQHTVAFLLNDNAERQIALYDLIEDKVSVCQFNRAEVTKGRDIPTIDTLRYIQRDLSVGADITNYVAVDIEYIRDLNVSFGKILFSYNNGDGLYRMGMIDGHSAMLQTNNITGGVYSPSLTGGGAVYMARLSEGKQLAMLDEDWSGTNFIVSFEAYTLPLADEIDTTLFVETDYRAGKYFLPRIWIPMIESVKTVDSFGLMSYISDPLEANIIIPTLTYFYVKPFLNADILWQNSAYPVRITAEVSDRAGYADSSETYYRATSGFLSFSRVFRFKPFTRALYAEGNFNHTAIALDNGEKSPYLWDYSKNISILGLSVGYSDLAAKYTFYDYEGISFKLYGDYQIQNPAWKTEMALSFSPSFMKMLVKMYAAYASEAVLNPSAVSTTFLNAHYPVFNEYKSEEMESDYYLYGDVSFLIYNFEIQRGLNAYPVYFKRAYLTGGYRAAFLDNRYLQSVYLRLKLQTGVFYQLGFNPYFELNYRINTQEFGIDYNVSLDLSVLGLGRDSMFDDEIEQ